MPRKHSGGFVERDFYWNIGEGPRGRDGMDAREAAQRYNDHRHPAIELSSAAEVDAWINEVENISQFDDTDGIQGGSIVPTAANLPIRKPGDLMRFAGLVWVYIGDGEVSPLGVGDGCYVDASNNYEFVRETRYSSIPLVSSRAVLTTDEAAQGLLPAQLQGEQVSAYLIQPYKFTSARSRPLVFVRASVRLTPTGLVDETDPATQDILDQFPRRARVMLFRRDLEQIQNIDEVYDISGGLLNMPVYSDTGEEGDPTLSEIPISQAREDRLSVVSSNPLALRIDEDYYMLLNADTHVYSADEVQGSAYTADQVNAVTRCSAEIESITLEVESFLGVPPFVDQQSGLRYTTWERP